MKAALNYSVIGEFPGNIKAMLELAAKYGFKAIEATPALVEEYGVENTIEVIKEIGIGISVFSMPFRPVESSNEEYEKNIAAFEQKVEIMEKVGCKMCFTFVRSSSDEYEFEDNYEFHVKRWKPVAEILKKHGMKLALEFLGPKTTMLKKRYPFIRTADALLPLCRDIGDNCGLAFDFWHWYSSGADRDVFEKINGTKYIYHVHLNDACPGNVDELMDKPRMLVGTSGVIDTQFLLSKLNEYGYDGYCISESFSEELKRLPSLEDKVRRTKEAIDHALK
ncbi:MAG: sugar phosphate isomerase/epimerase [Erysipelotrichaceae bacterium]|nr:sugar phosphate isomerase/epimerase [Erysipelotrichaceae bacterium]